MYFKFSSLFLSLTLMSANVYAQNYFDVEGHRGCRGLYPENTIVAFLEAVKLGVTTLEMDVVVSKDGKLIVSHDPWMNPDICLFPKGQPDQEDAKKLANLYKMTAEEIVRYDCGTPPNSKFPEQKKMFAAKPLLSDVIDTVEKFIASNHLAFVQYNIETKSTSDGDDVFHPKPDVFAKLLYDLLKQKKILGKCIIQSFDPRTLQAVRKTDTNVKLALLVFNADGFEKNIKRLGFHPEIYSPNFILVNKKLISKSHHHKMKIIPWTINEEDKMKKLKDMGVDGIITDYPDRLIKVCKQN